MNDNAASASQAGSNDDNPHALNLDKFTKSEKKMQVVTSGRSLTKQSLNKLKDFENLRLEVSHEGSGEGLPEGVHSLENHAGERSILLHGLTQQTDHQKIPHQLNTFGNPAMRLAIPSQTGHQVEDVIVEREEALEESQLSHKLRANLRVITIDSA